MTTRKLLLAAGAIGLLLTGAAQAATNESTMTATLDITPECEVITAPIGASKDNFPNSDATLITTGDYNGSFTIMPAGLTAPTTSAGDTDNVAVLCSAGGSNHNISFSTVATMKAGANEIAWTAKLGGTAFVNQQAATTIPANPTAATVSKFKVTGTVEQQVIADAVPGLYTADVLVDVSF